MDKLLGFAAGLAVAAVLYYIVRLRRRGRSRTTIHSSVEAIRSIGELVALKAVTKQIVTSRDHLFGDWGERWLAWLLSSKRTAIVFEFVVDFRYDLRSPAFDARTDDGNDVVVTLPPAFYTIQMKDMHIYDERGAALVPVLLPEWIGQIFGGKFSEKEKNQLIQAARAEAEGLARALVADMIAEVRRSAEATLSGLVRGLGFRNVRFRFSDDEPERRAVDLGPIEETVERALAGAR